ncbi:MAG: type II toxin-antitoxin system HicA family toxin [Limisphaerales bacterium]
MWIQEIEWQDRPRTWRVLFLNRRTVYKAREVLSKPQCAGFVVRRQSGSRVVLRHSDGRQTYVATHSADVPTGTFRSILK